jgi:hypothetical protein
MAAWAQVMLVVSCVLIWIFILIVTILLTDCFTVTRNSRTRRKIDAVHRQMEVRGRIYAEVSQQRIEDEISTAYADCPSCQHPAVLFAPIGICTRCGFTEQASPGRMITEQ